jgi:hypothetical protein
VTGGRTYYIRVEGYAGAFSATSYSLGVSCPVPLRNDSCSNAVVISSSTFTDMVDTTRATTDSTDPVHSCTGQQDSNSVWYRFTAPINGTATVNTFGSNYDTVLSAYVGSCSSLREIACHDDVVAAEQRQSTIAFDITTGVTYFIEVATFGSEPSGTLVFNFQITNSVNVQGTWQGTWSVTRDTCGGQSTGDFAIEFHLMQFGNSISGSFTPPQLGHGTVTGTVNGNSLSLVIHYADIDIPCDVRVPATVTGVTMNGVIDEISQCVEPQRVCFQFGTFRATKSSSSP